MIVTVLLVLTCLSLFASTAAAINLKHSLSTFNLLKHAKVWQLQEVSKKMENWLLAIAVLDIFSISCLTAAVLVRAIA